MAIKTLSIVCYYSPAFAASGGITILDVELFFYEDAHLTSVTLPVKWEKQTRWSKLKDSSKFSFLFLINHSECIKLTRSYIHFFCTKNAQKIVITMTKLSLKFLYQCRLLYSFWSKITFKVFPLLTDSNHISL